MESFEFALARNLVRKEGYTWFPPGALFPEASLFKSEGGRGVLIRIVRGQQPLSLSGLLDSSFAEANDILNDHPYRGITVLQLIIYPDSPGPEQELQLKSLERHQTAPDIAVYTAWFDFEKRTLRSNLPWFGRGILPQPAVLEAAHGAEEPKGPHDPQEDILQILEQRNAEWKNVYAQKSSKAVRSLSAIMIGMFLWMSATGPVEDPLILFRFGAKVNELILAGEYWRLVTPMFIHASALHLIVNAFALYSLRDAEWIYGSNRFLLVFLLAGVSGNAASFAFSPYPAVGASGAIFGILGSLLYFGTQKKEFFRRTMGSAVWTTLAINLLLGFIVPQISNSGHIGGLLGGFLAAAATGLPAQPFRWTQPLAAVALAALLTGEIWLGFQGISL